MKKGTFIVLEGGDGSGKSTMVKLAQELFAKHDNIIFSREPGGTPYAESIREVILHPQGKSADSVTMFALYWAARTDHMRNRIIPALKENRVVIADRFDSSSYAYQIYGQENPELKELFWHMRKVFVDGYEPDLYVFFDVDPKEGIRRINTNRSNEKNHFDERDIDFHTRVRNGYLEFLKKVPHVVINANLSLEKVKEEFTKVVNKLIGQKKLQKKIVSKKVSKKNKK